MGSGKTILIASNSFLLLKGLEQQLNRLGVNLIGIATNQHELEINIIKLKPNFVLLHYENSNFKLEKTLAFSAITTGSNLFIIVDEISGKEIKKAFREGVKAIISREVSEQSLNDCVVKLKNGDQFLDPILTFDELENPNNKLAPTLIKLSISERECEIIKLIAEGYINKEIADKLFLSTHTVNTHRKNIMTKLGISNTAGIVLFAVKEQLVSVDQFLFSSKT